MADLSNCVGCLSEMQLKILKSDLLDAGLALEHKQKNTYRKIFSEGRRTSSGKLKKLYAALYKTDENKLDRLITVLLEEIEHDCA